MHEVLALAPILAVGILLVGLRRPRVAGDADRLRHHTADRAARLAREFALAGL